MYNNRGDDGGQRSLHDVGLVHPPHPPLHLIIIIIIIIVVVVVVVVIVIVITIIIIIILKLMMMIRGLGIFECCHVFFDILIYFNLF